MTFLLFMRKAWSWLKNYWYIPVIAIGIIGVWLYTQKRPDQLIEIIKKNRQFHKEEVKKLEEIHKEEIKAREVALEKYHKTVEEIEKNYKDSQEKLDRKKKKEIKKLIKESKDDPDLLTKKIAELTGFEVHVD